MTPGQKQVLTFVGNAGGRLSTTAACLVGLDVDIALCITQGYLYQGVGYYLMGTVGENALAAALAPAA